METITKTVKALALTLAAIALTGCAPVASKPERKTYEYDVTATVNGMSCNTKNIYNDFALYCRALADEALNGSCGRENREQLYVSSGCQGEFDYKIDLDIDADPTVTFSSTPEPKFSYSFEITHGADRCSTGVKTASTRGELCRLALIDSANNNCARNERTAYAAACGAD